MTNIFNSILLASFWGSILTILFLLINKLFKNKLSISWCYYIWIIVIIRLLIPAHITVYVEPKHNPIMKQVNNNYQIESDNGNNILTDNTNIQLISEKDINTINKPKSLQMTFIEHVSNVKQIFYSTNLWIIWLIVSIIIMCYKLISYLVYIKKIKSNYILPNANETNIFENQKKNFNIRKKIVLYKNEKAQVPFAMGLLNPLVIFPNKEYTNIQLNYIFCHELNHITRYDIVIKWLFGATTSIHWFNPFVYIA